MSYLMVTAEKYLKGKVGELRVQSLLNQLNPRDYLVLNNILLNVDGESVQIDHVVVSLYGIFVIETKNYQGQIYGLEASRSWKQYIYGNETKIYNPTWQNYGHMMTIQNMLPEHLQKSKIIPIVTFPDTTEVKVVAKKTHIINNHELLKIIESYQYKVYSYNDIYTIKYYLENSSTKGFFSGIKHVIKVKKIIRQKSY